MSSTRYFTRIAAAAALAFAFAAAGTPSYADVQQNGGQNSALTCGAAKAATATGQQAKTPSRIEALEDPYSCCHCERDEHGECPCPCE